MGLFDIFKTKKPEPPVNRGLPTPKRTPQMPPVRNPGPARSDRMERPGSERSGCEAFHTIGGDTYVVQVGGGDSYSAPSSDSSSCSSDSSSSSSSDSGSCGGGD